MLPVFPLLIAAYLPGRIRAAVKHPLLAATKAWALAPARERHARRRRAVRILLVWAVADRISLKRRHRVPCPCCLRSRERRHRSHRRSRALRALRLLAHAALFGCLAARVDDAVTARESSAQPAAEMPRGIPFIVVNEFAERFCFYGINSILAIFLVQYMQFGQAQATTWASLFKSGAYFLPLLGAIVSDVFLAKFRTIIIFSIVYCIGCIVLAASAGSTTMLAAGLFLVAFGPAASSPASRRTSATSSRAATST
jgi:hypothetical protein